MTMAVVGVRTLLLYTISCRSPGPLGYLPRQRRSGIARGTLYAIISALAAVCCKLQGCKG